MRSRLALRTLCLLATFGASGCSTVPRVVDFPDSSPTHGYSYYAGRATQSFEAPVSATATAVHEAMVDLNIGSIQPRPDGGLPRLAGKSEDRREVLVVIRSQHGL